MAAETLRQPLFDLENVFQVDDYLYFYSEMLTDDRSDAEVAALVKLLSLDRPLDILDLACGFGRHANRLAALGHRLTGVDYTPGFLDLARAEAARRSLPVDYRQGDMRQVTFQSAFDCVLLLFTAFGYFVDDDNLRVLQNAAHALRPGGLFITDVPNRDTILQGFLPFIVLEKDGNLMIDRNTFDSLAGLLRNQRIIIRNGVRRDLPFAIRLYNPAEMHALLKQAGFGEINLFGGWDGEPVSVDSRRLVVVARKPG